MSENKAKASDVAAGFIQYYYTSLSNGVDNVLKCYAEESTVKLFDNDAVTGLKEIETELKKRYNSEFKIRIHKINAINSLANSVFIQFGAEYYSNGSYRPVIRSVVLVSRGSNQFYIHSDSVDYVSSLVPTAVQAPAPKIKQNGHAPVQHHEQPEDPKPKTPQRAPQPPTPQRATAPITPQRASQPSTPQRAPAPPAPKAPAEPTPTTPLAQLAAVEPTPKLPSPIQKPTGPTTWSKVVSGQAKSNGLPPPTAPPVTIQQQSAPPQQQQQTGHNAQQSFGKGSRNSSNCFKCGGSGHYSRDCTSTTEKSRPIRRCYTCNEPGHMSRECPSANA